MSGEGASTLASPTYKSTTENGYNQRCTDYTDSRSSGQRLLFLGVRGKLQQTFRLSSSQPLEGEQLAAPTGCRRATSDEVAVKYTF